REKLSGERKGREIERDIRRDLIPIWGKLPISEITDESILDVIELKAKTAPTQVRNLLGTVKRFFAWAKNSRNRRRYGEALMAHARPGLKGVYDLEKFPASGTFPVA